MTTTMVQSNESIFQTDISNEKETKDIVPVFRFKFSNDVVDALTYFANVHKHDARVDYKEAWTTWVNENQDMISRETERLSRIGFDGDLIDRMYKSARYYYRNKSTETVKPVERRQYTGVGNEMLNIMDTQIKTYFMLFEEMENQDDDVVKDKAKEDATEDVEKPKKTPANGYILFHQQHESEIQEVVEKLCGIGSGMSAEDVEMKLKKTYKNRYYRYSRKMGSAKKIIVEIVE